MADVKSPFDHCPQIPGEQISGVVLHITDFNNLGSCTFVPFMHSVPIHNISAFVMTVGVETAS
jgi:hypothetical protein